MRKKIFTFLLALVASVGMSWADEVTIVFAANNNTKEVTVELPHTFWCSFDDEDGELDLIIQELYGLSMSGFCGDYAPTATGNAAVTAGTKGEDHYITISDVFAGTATVEGSYFGYYQPLEGGAPEAHEKEYSLTISIKNYTPEPVLAVANTLQLHVNDALMGSLALQDPSNDIFDFGDGTYGVPEGASVTLIATPNEGYEFIGWKASSSICDFNDCEFIALSTVENPLTFDMYAEAAFMAEFAAVASQPATTVTWNSSNIGNLTVNGNSYSKEGITLGPNASNNYAYWLDYGDESQNGIYFYVNATGGHTFSNSLGKNFTKIEMTLNGSTGWYVAYLGSGWNIDGMKAIWTGNASTVDLLTETSSFGGAAGVKSIVFYFEGDSEEPEPEPEGDGKLTGAFTINANGDQIVFSKGNLQYQASTTTWQFATNQYDMIGEDNANISDTYTGWIDLFGWGTGNNPTNTSEQDEDYSTFTDWGANAISNGGNEANLWRTLTIQEWGYLIKTRTNADNLKGQATVADVHGYVLLPDSWTLPAGLSFTASPNDWTTNDYTAEQWTQQMEAAGAVFLPAAGYRNPDIVYVDEKGWYWSSDVLTANAAYDFEFTETTSRVFGSRHYFGQPVRLVTAAPAVAPQPAEDVDITPNADPDHASVYYSTFFDSSVKYELPAGVEAYVADLSGANLLLTKIAEAGEVIPANVAVILKSTVTPFTLTVSDAEAVTFTATNDLQGSDTQIATPDNCYVLAGNDGVGFYHYTASMLNPHKAYVIYSGSQAPKRMPFIFDQATGVESVQPAAISSQKVIENGQLFIIKNGVKYNAQGQVVK